MPAFPREELEEMMERWLEASRQAKGELLPGHERIREEPGRIEKLKNSLALVRIALLG